MMKAFVWRTASTVCLPPLLNLFHSDIDRRFAHAGKVDALQILTGHRCLLNQAGADVE